MLAPLSPGFMVLQGNQLEDLRDVAVQWLADNPLRPLEHECILVQSNGIAQWLKIALASNAQGTGIAAAMDVQLPGRFIWQAYRSVFDSLPSRSPYDKIPLAWRLYLMLRNWSQLQTELGTDADSLAPLAGFLSVDEKDPRRCHQLAARLADLYDQYQLYRADWLEAWEQGRDVLIRADGSEQPMPPGQRWQAVLWRALHQRINQEPSTDRWTLASRARIHREFISACRQFTPEQRPVGLPRRVIVFSISSLPRQTLELLQALSPFTQVMVFATNPSRHYWGDLVEGRELLRREYRRLAARKSTAQVPTEELHAYGHPLLASWGKQGRDFLHLLDEHDQPDSYRQLFNHHSIDLFNEPDFESQGLLQQLQADILNLDSLADRQQRDSQIDPDQDNSLQFLIAHSPQREVEILHDQLLDSFEQARNSGQNLQPRDILVMVPDINIYAPHIHAVFGQHARTADGPRDGRYLPYHISDQSQRRQNTLLIALESLLQLPESRFSVSQLSDLLDTPALRARFGLEESDLPALRRWIKGANIRWGLDAEQRSSLELPGISQNSWLFGLQRMLLGYAAGADQCWQGIEAYDEVAGLEASLLGPLAQLLDSLQQGREQLAQEHVAADWPVVLQQLLSDFFADSGPTDSWALGQLELQLERLHDIWQDAGLSDEPLPLDVVRQELLAGLDEPNLTQKFLAGSINFATLMPMRAIPFRQLWLLGMNDKDYPRSTSASDFDLMANDYRPGDRSRREDDRYLFLEALLSARDRLVISWVGHDIRDNTEKPPSVLVSQLRDHIAAGWKLAGAAPDAKPEALLDALTTAHPLQAFSRSYFEQARDPRLFTYAHEWRPLHNPPTSETSDSAVPLDWQPEAPLTLTALTRFLRNPVAFFYSMRLGIQWQRDNEETLDTESFHADGLHSWQLRDNLIERVTRSLHLQPELSVEPLLEQALERLQRSGDLPVMPFGELLQTQLHDELLKPMQNYRQLLLDYPQQQAPLSHTLTLNEADKQPELVLHDSLADIRCNAQGDALRLILQPSVLYDGKSKKYHHLVRQWPAHLLAQLQQPVTTRLLGPNTDFSLPPLPKHQAENLLLEALDSLRQGMQRPLPLPCKTAFALLENSSQVADIYQGSSQIRGERDDTPGLQRSWPDYDQLAADPDFQHYAELLYQPLLAHCRTADDDKE